MQAINFMLKPTLTKLKMGLNLQESMAEGGTWQATSLLEVLGLILSEWCILCLLSLSVHASFFEISWLPPTAHRLRIRWIRESKFPTGKNGSVCVYLSICVSSVIDWQHVEGFPCLLQYVLVYDISLLHYQPRRKYVRKQ